MLSFLDQVLASTVWAVIADPTLYRYNNKKRMVVLDTTTGSRINFTWHPDLLIPGYSLHRKGRSLVVLLFPEHSNDLLAGAIYTGKKKQINKITH